MVIQIVLAVVFVYLYGAGLRWLERLTERRRPAPPAPPLDEKPSSYNPKDYGPYPHGIWH
jgi:hypothetical protein